MIHTPPVQNKTSAATSGGETQAVVAQNIESDGGNTSESDRCEGREIKKRKKKRAYVQKFKKQWKNEENMEWLEEKQNSAKCKICDVFIRGGITHVRRHKGSERHKKKMKILHSTPQVQQLLKVDKNQELIKTGVKKGELKMLMFVAEHNLPFSILDHLPQLIRSVCIDSEIAKSLRCGRDKGTSICKNVIAPENLKMISENMRNNWYSLIIDETTDISTAKCLAIVARFYRGEKIQDNFLGLIEIQELTAQALFDSVCGFLTKNNIPVQKMIGFAADNASVMSGNRAGVAKKFEELLPDIFILGCVCHSLALCSSAACAKLPSSVESLARDIISYFSRSSKRLMGLKEHQIFCDIKPHKLLKLSQTRWLSLQAVVNRILEQWQPLVHFLTTETFSKANEKDSIRPDDLLNAMKNNIFKLYFSFLSYILDIINKMNILFQSESPQIHKLHDEVTSLFKTILKNFMKESYLQTNSLHQISFSPSNYRQIEELYVGANCEAIIMSDPEMSRIEINNFRIKCLDFYVELAKQIKKRFDFNDPVLIFLKNFDPKAAVSGTCQSLVPLALRFPRLHEDVEKLNSEWRLLPDVASLKDKADHLDFHKFWREIFEMKNTLKQLMFPNLTCFLKGIFCLPHSSANAERVFSQLNLIKTKNRNKLKTETCNSLLHTKSFLGRQKCYEFDPPDCLLRQNVSQDDVIDEDITF